MKEELYIDHSTGRLWCNPIWFENNPKGEIPKFMPKDVKRENLEKVESEEIYYCEGGVIDRDNGLRIYRNEKNLLAALIAWDITPLWAIMETRGIWYSGVHNFNLKNVITCEIHDKYDDSDFSDPFKTKHYIIAENTDDKWGAFEIFSKCNRKNPVMHFKSAIPFSYSSAKEAFDELKVDSNNAAFVDVRKPKDKFVVYDFIGYTPENITELSYNDVFVFGSNLEGKHMGGAAKTAYKKFGAVWGLGVGPAGNSYAIPTMQVGIETIKPYIDQFLQYAKDRRNKRFYVTEIGCGIAGRKVEEIAPLFKAAVKLSNVILPKSFVEVLRNA